MGWVGVEEGEREREREKEWQKCCLFAKQMELLLNAFFFSAFCNDFAVISCGVPEVGSRVIIYGTNFTYDQEVTFACPVGYDINGPENATCMADGKWSYGMERPNCQGELCSQITTKRHNQVNHELTSQFVMSFYYPGQKKRRKNGHRLCIKSEHCSLSWDMEKSSLIARRCSDAWSRVTVLIPWCIEVMITRPHMILRDKNNVLILCTI